MRRQQLLWHDLEDEVTRDLNTLSSIALAPASVVDDSATIAELRKIFIERRVPAIAVVDSSRCLQGIVTRTDVLSVDSAARTAGDVMSSFVFALPLDSTIEAAAALMALEGVSQVVVTNHHGELAGIVSALDIARHVAVRAGYVAA